MTTAKLIDGYAIAENLRAQIRLDVDVFRDRLGVAPGLDVILVGDQAPSQIYVRNKQTACATVGIRSTVHRLPGDVDELELIALIKRLNVATGVHGILIQLPLPPHLDTQKILEVINPLKDVDGLHPYNLGRLIAGQPVLTPCTPQGCMHLICSVLPSLSGMRATIVGRSVLVGKPLMIMLMNADATVTMAHSRTCDLMQVCAQSDVLVCAIGSPGFITADYIKPGAVVIDVGINRVQQTTGEHIIRGDVDFSGALTKAGFITPVPRGVGPMTIGYLLVNTIKAAQLQVG
ncbi:MAG: bifunctional methylenetetrahydrofolate dehydrogenase/methenyltetrahydrofolate cyclohydrolase FolD [Alphaproteobacteria bacterium]|nr:bifunctional methylenetetrahydrofolate dehydrogenase/methenyltetrahydrofolate cyclohydrolase FolD [Alphaproteobacteria bacterium]